MKTLALIGMIVSATVLAANSIDMVGTFAVDTQVAMPGIADAEACTGDGAEWNGDMCVIASQDTVSVTRAENGGLTMNISLVGTNAHMCDFSGEAVPVGRNVLVAAVEGCVVTATFADSNTVSIANNGGCQEHCGANMILELDGATRRNAAVAPEAPAQEDEEMCRPGAID